MPFYNVRIWTHDLMICHLGHVESSIGKMGTLSTEGLWLASILPLTLVDILWLHHYHQNYSTCPKYDIIPNISKLRKQSPFVVLGQLVWTMQTPIDFVSNNNMKKLAKSEKYKSKSNEQSGVVWKDECYLPLEQCEWNNCLLLIHVILILSIICFSISHVHRRCLDLAFNLLISLFIFVLQSMFLSFFTLFPFGLYNPIPSHYSVLQGLEK